MSTWSEGVSVIASAEPGKYPDVPVTKRAPQPAAAQVFTYDRTEHSTMKCPCCQNVLVPIEFVDFYPWGRQ